MTTRQDLRNRYPTFASAPTRRASPIVKRASFNAVPWLLSLLLLFVVAFNL